MPSLCKTSFRKTNQFQNNSVKMSRTPYSENSFYIVENDFIWFVNEVVGINRTAWPQKISYIFPTMTGQIDAILFDDSKNEFLIFKVIIIIKYTVNFFFKTKPNINKVDRVLEIQISRD